jgi:hypothetical protein
MMMDHNQSNLINLKICSLNSHGILGNLFYVNYLIDSNDIVFICEKS